MTRGGLTIDQKMVDSFIESNIKTTEDFGKTINLEGLGFPEINIDFKTLREFASRGLCLDLQRRERGSTSIKMSDIKGALNSENPLEFLRSKGYDSKILQKLGN